MTTKNVLDYSLAHAKRTILNELNINLNLTEETMSQPDGNDTRIFRVDMPISTQQVGPLAPMFKSIDIEITVVIFKNHDLRLVYNYTYKHPFGSNGFTVARDFILSYFDSPAIFGEYQVKA